MAQITLIKGVYYRHLWPALVQAFKQKNDSVFYAKRKEGSQDVSITKSYSHVLGKTTAQQQTISYPPFPA